MSDKLQLEGATTSKIHNLFPEDLIIDQTNNNREPYSQEEIEVKAKHMEEGQLQPIGIRKDGDKYHVIFGFGRCLGMRLLNERNPENRRKITCKVFNCNKEEAFRLNIKENKDRKELTVIDIAKSQRKAREEFGWTDGEIADFYGCTPGWVSQLKNVLNLDGDLQRKVQTGEIGAADAINLGGLSDQERAETLQEIAATLPEGSGAQTQLPQAQAKPKLTEVIRKKKRQKAETNGKSLKRNLKEVRGFVEGMTGPAEPEKVKKWAVSMLKFCDGEIKEETFAKNLKHLLS